MRVRINPNSSSCAVNGIMEAAEGSKMLKISIRAVPEKGKANKELIEFVAQKLKLPKSSLEIVSGETDRVKRILIRGKSKDISERLLDWLGDVMNDE